jgi:hypothetical protein
VNTTSNPKIAIVKAYAASNSSQISETQLREELGKELEHSVSLILDELNRKDKLKHLVTSTQPSNINGREELERLDGEENETISTTETLQEESENSIITTSEATMTVLISSNVSTNGFFYWLFNLIDVFKLHHC